MNALPSSLSGLDPTWLVITLITLMALLLPGLLFLRLQREQKQLEAQNRRSMVLIDLPKRAECLEEHDFMQYALEQAEALTDSQIGFMHFINDDGESIELIAWSRNTLEKHCTAIANRHYPISEAGIWADAARTREPLIVNDYAKATKRSELPAGHSVMHRLLSVPVIEGGQVRMMTGVGNKADNYSAYDVETIQLISNETWRIVCRQRSDKALRLAMQVVNASPVVCFRWAATDRWPVIFV
jgi:hypothetical protein